MFSNCKPRELTIDVFSYMDSIKKRIYDEGEFRLEDLIDEFLECNLPTDGSNYQKQKDDECENIDKKIRPYLLKNGYVEEVDNILNFVRLTAKGKEAISLGGIDKYEEKENKEYELNKLKEENLKAPIEANKIAEKANIISEGANRISKRAKNISLWSLLFAILSTFIAAGALVYSIINSDSNEIKKLNDKIESIEEETVLIKEQYLKEHKEYVRHIDSLYTEINKLKN